MLLSTNETLHIITSISGGYIVALVVIPVLSVIASICIPLYIMKKSNENTRSLEMLKYMPLLIKGTRRGEKIPSDKDVMLTISDFVDLKREILCDETKEKSNCIIIKRFQVKNTDLNAFNIVGITIAGVFYKRYTEKYVRKGAFVTFDFTGHILRIGNHNDANIKSASLQIEDVHRNEYTVPLTFGIISNDKEIRTLELNNVELIKRGK
jgi:hypothetical protein